MGDESRIIPYASDKEAFIRSCFDVEDSYSCYSPNYAVMVFAGGLNTCWIRVCFAGAEIITQMCLMAGGAFSADSSCVWASQPKVLSLDV